MGGDNGTNSAGLFTTYLLMVKYKLISSNVGGFGAGFLGGRRGPHHYICS